MTQKPKLGTIQAQFIYLKKLRRLKIKKLRDLHDDTFQGTRWRLAIPRDCPRDYIEKRLWVYYAVRHYHYPKGHPAKIAFSKRAKAILSNTDIQCLPQEDLYRIRRREHQRFSWDAIKAMELVEIERYLTMAGVYVEAPPGHKRQLLYELYHKPKEELPDEVIRANRGSRINNKYVLRDLVIENPGLDYEEFMKEYGDRMPTTSRASFNSTRCQLRRAGYKIPYGKPGPRNPAVVNGKANR